MGKLADIVRIFGPSYRERFGEGLLPSHDKALRDIARCHTEELGGHRYHCHDCGEDHFQYHSCRSRACPDCQGNARDAWIDARLEDLLPCRYFHLVFTVPGELSRIIRSHQEALLGVVMQSAGKSLLKLALDPKLLGGKIGILAVLHTWGSVLEYHPHVHCLVPGGALVKESRVWQTGRESFFLPVRALSRVFRGMFLECLAKVIPKAEIPAEVYRKEWVVFCKAVVQGPEKVIEYLGRYIHRTAIADGRIRKVEDGRVSFDYKDYRDGKKKLMTLDAHEFLRRFLQHVLPRGFCRVRYYGLFSPSCRKEFHSLQVALWNLSGCKFPEMRPRSERVLACPKCGSIKVSLCGVLTPVPRAPPGFRPKAFAAGQPISVSISSQKGA